MSQATQRLSILLESYIQKRKRLKWSTVDQTRQAWKHLIMAVGDVNASDLKPTDIEDFESYLFSVGLVARSVKSYLVAARPVLAWAVRHEMATGNPFEGYKLPRVPDTEIHTYTQAELCDILAVANLRWQALVMTAATAGLRKSECLNLVIQDVDFERQTITIQPHKETLTTWGWTPKNSQARVVPLTDELSKIFCEILAEELPSGQPYLLLSEKRYWTLRQCLQQGTLTDRQRLWPDEGFSKTFRQLRLKAGLQVGTFHDLRRTCLTNWSYHLPPQDLMRLAEHADIETTMRYYLIVRDDVLTRAKQTTFRGDKI